RHAVAGDADGAAWAASTQRPAAAAARRDGSCAHDSGGLEGHGPAALAAAVRRVGGRGWVRAPRRRGGGGARPPPLSPLPFAGSEVASPASAVIDPTAREAAV